MKHFLPSGAAIVSIGVKAQNEGIRTLTPCRQSAYVIDTLFFLLQKQDLKLKRILITK